MIPLFGNIQLIARIKQWELFAILWNILRIPPARCFRLNHGPAGRVQHQVGLCISSLRIGTFRQADPSTADNPEVGHGLGPCRPVRLNRVIEDGRPGGPTLPTKKVAPLCGV